MDAPTDEEIQNIADNIKKRNAARKRRIAERIAQAREFLPLVVEEFQKIDPAIREIILFGSLVAGNANREDFDIDIAVSSDRYLTLVAWALNQEFRIDVVDLESVPDHVLEAIRGKGEVLFTRISYPTGTDSKPSS